MKLGILTQPLEENYGGILQAFALQQVLKKLGHKAVVINRVCSDTVNRDFITRFKHFAGRVYRFPQHKNFRRLFRPQNYMEQKTRDKIFKHTYQFINKYIESSPRLVSDNDFKHYVRNNNFNGYIVGSDQCWRPKFSPNIYTYFLDYCKNQENIKRVAYAASFGVDEWEFSDEDTKICSQLIQKFDAVSVREDSGVKLCADYLNYKSATHLLDPTLLLYPEDYISILQIRDYPISEGNMMTYVLDKSDDKLQIVEKVTTFKKLTPFSVIAKHDYYDPKCYPLKDCVQPPVEKWLRGFMDAQFVVADSFHGCVFAILFNKPFIAIGNHERGLTRFTSLLKLFDLKERLVFSANDITEELLNKEINWEQVNSRKDELKEQSIRFLKDNIKQ